MKKFIEELKRRNVIKASLAYLVIAWIIVQVAQAVLPTFGAPDWVLKALIIGLAIGLPIWIIISWIYEITPEGIEKTAKESGSELVTQATNKRLNAFIIISLSIAVIVLTLNLTNVFSSNSDKKYSIAVLPFKDMSSEDTQWFCDGVTDNILNHLSPLKNLLVISRTSSDSYKGTDKRIPEIMKELDADYILEGSVTKHNNKVKIIVQLINTNDEHIWSKEYTDSFDDIFAVQQNVSKEIAKKLIKTLSPEEEKFIGEHLTDNKEAYQLYLNATALYEETGGTKETLERVIKMFQHAIDLDPNFTSAYAYLAGSYYGWGNKAKPFEEVEDKINDLLNKALEINPNTPAIYRIKGLIEWEEYNRIESAGEYFKKALKLNPNDPWSNYMYGQYFWDKPAPDVKNTLKYWRIAQRLEPLTKSFNRGLFNALIRNDKIEEAEELHHKTSFLYKSDINIYRESLINVFKNKDWMESIHLFEKELEKDPKNIFFIKQLALNYRDILIDRKKASQYVRLAYELDSINNTRSLIWDLVFNNKMKEVKLTFDETMYENYLWYDAYLNGTPDKAMEYFNKKEFDKPKNKILTFSKKGDIDSINELRAKHKISNVHMASVYANLKERDSMYHYMNSISKITDALSVNYKREFDPYRKEERYKAFLKKNYLPLTHWNE